MVRALALSIIVAIVVSFTAVSNTTAQSTGYNQYGERSEALSWEMYKQRQVETQLEIQRQQLEMQRQQLEIQRQQQQMELEKQMIERQKK